jgi:hypothetical protein
MTGTFEQFRGLGRIGVDPEQVKLYDFNAFVVMSGISPGDVFTMRRLGREQHANPIHWLASFEPVHSESWAAVQVYDGKRRVALKDWREKCGMRAMRQHPPAWPDELHLWRMMAADGVQPSGERFLQCV